ncbi:glycosyltransferase family 2 protein [Patescibacteria group bacterium]|nr:glycosyltransferase family 2 protein [Patescibacteria group bacterium]
MPTKVSVIILNYNGSSCLPACVDSVLNSSYSNIEIVVFDNHSPDHSLDLLRLPKYKNCLLISSNKNVGFAQGNNLAAKKATGEYLYFINNDSKIAKDTIEILISNYEAFHPGIATTSILSYDGKTLYHTGIAADIFGFPLTYPKMFYAEGSSLFISKELFFKAGTFDGDYFMFHEDVDLCWRIRLMGFDILSVPEAKLFHLAGQSAGGGPPKTGNYRSTILRRYYSERNNLLTLLKNYQLTTLIFILPLYFLINLSEIILFIFNLRFRLVYLYIKAYLWNIYHFPKTLQKRFQVQSQRQQSDLSIIKHMYFGSGKFYMFFKIGLPEFK